MLNIFWCFIGFYYYYSLKCSWKKISPHRSFWQFLQMSAHQSVCILTNTQFHPSWCDYCLEWSHYTLDCMLSDRNPFSNQNNNSKEHNYFRLFCILKPTCKYYLAGFEFFFVKWLSCNILRKYFWVRAGICIDHMEHIPFYQVILLLRALMRLFDNWEDVNDSAFRKWQKFNR